MATRKHKKPGSPVDLHERLKAHINAASRVKEAERMRDEWARKGLALSKAGKIEQARDALAKCEWWDRQRQSWQQRLAEIEAEMKGPKRNP